MRTISTLQDIGEDNNCHSKLLILLVFAISIFSLMTIYIIANDTFESSPVRLVSMVIISLNIAIITYTLLQYKDGIDIDIRHPLSFYGIFYVLYYIIPYLLVLFTNISPVNNELTIAVMILIGYLSWYIGVTLSPLKENRNELIEWSNKRETQILLTLCVIGIGLVVYIYSWRAANGIFFNQAKYYEQELNVSASLRDVFFAYFQLPLILMLGLLSSIKFQRIATISRLLLMCYGGGIFLIFVLSSQTRPAITALIFILASIKFYSKFAIGYRHVALIIVMSIFSIFTVQAVRVVSGEKIASAENQFYYAIEHSIADALSAYNDNRLEMSKRLTSRASGGIYFLSSIIDKVEEEGSYLYGRGIANSLYSLVPRVIWPDKPSVDSPQIVVEKMLNMPLHDASLGPITQFYVEGGWLGLVTGFFLFGILMRWLTNCAMRSNNLGIWLIFIFVWSHVIQIEQELILGTLGALRNALVIYLLFRLFSNLFAKLKSSRNWR